MDGMKSMLGQQNKQGSSGLPGLGGEASLPKLPKFNFRMPSLPQAPGKPPVNINTVKSDYLWLFLMNLKTEPDGVQHLLMCQIFLLDWFIIISVKSN